MTKGATCVIRTAFNGGEECQVIRLRTGGFAFSVAMLGRSIYLLGKGG